MFEEFAVSFENFISVFSAFLIKYFLDLGIIKFLLFDFQDLRRPYASPLLICFPIAIERIHLPVPIKAYLRNENPKSMRNRLMVRPQQKLQNVLERSATAFPFI